MSGFIGNPYKRGDRDCAHGHLARSCRLCELEAEVERQAKALSEWEATGDAIMEAVVGRKAPLSDSDVIGEVERLRRESQQQRLLLEEAADTLSGLPCSCDIDEGRVILECERCGTMQSCASLAARGEEE